MRVRRAGSIELFERLTQARRKPSSPEPELPPGNPLLDALRAYPSGAVYTLASKAEMEAAFRNFRSEAVRRLTRGSGEGASLVVEVGSSPVHRVGFTLREGRAEPRCDCRDDSPAKGCSHVVCALITVKKVLDNGAFPTEQMDPEYRRILREHLLRAAEPAAVSEPARLPQPAALLIEMDGGRTDVRVLLNGETVVSPSYKVPRPLRIFQTFSSFAGPWWDPLKRYLAEHGNAFPILLRVDGKERELRWKGEMAGETRTVLDAAGGHIVVTHAASARGDGENGVFLRECFLFDVDGGNFGTARPDSGWKLWRSVYDAFRRGGVEASEGAGGTKSYVIRRKDFEDRILILEGEAARDLRTNATFRVDGRTVAPAPSPAPALRLLILPAPRGGDWHLLRAECRDGDRAFLPTDSAFRLFTRHGLPRTLQSRGLDGVLIDAFFEALPGKSAGERRRAVREAIGRAQQAPPVARECARLVEFHVERCREDETGVRVSKDGWRLFPGDRRRQALIFEVPYRLFGAGIFAAAKRPGEMEVAGEALREKLPHLCARLAEHGIGLSLDGKPVRPASWEIEIDATSKAIDWFEIRPEIRCDGTLLSEAEWAGAMVRQGFVEKDGVIRILDEPARNALLALRAAAAKPRKGSPREVVRVPRLAILELIHWRRLGVKVRLSEEDREIVDRLSGFRRIEERPLPGDLAERLRPYQKEGASWLAFLYEHRFGACLADDMGLGKTVQAIALLAGLREGKIRSRAAAGAPSLVVCPPTLLFNWENEIRKFHPSLSVRAYRGKDRSTDFSGVDVVLASYDLVRRDVETLSDLSFDVIVFDEAQAVKNLFAGATGAVRRLRGAFKLALTGTPVENHLGEYFAIVDLVLPGLFGEYDDLKAKIRRPGPEFLEEVKRKSRPFVLRRTKGQILSDLPPKTEDDVFLELTERQKALYRRTVQEVRQTVDDAYRTKNEAQARVIALTALLKLRQICLSPALLVPGAAEPSPKVSYLLEKLAELREEGHSALVFSQFTSFLDIAGEELSRAGFAYVRLDGSTPVAQRQRLVESFQGSDGPSVFQLSLKAGGKGLNLTKATYVFHLDPWWNPAVENQASDRTHRIGQTNRVTVQRILMRHTVEEKMMELKARKVSLYAALLREAENRGTSAITKADFDRLLAGE